MKRFMSVLLALAMVLSMVTVPAMADNPRNIVPQESVQKVGKRFPITLAPYSITVLVIE